MRINNGECCFFLTTMTAPLVLQLCEEIFESCVVRVFMQMYTRMFMLMLYMLSVERRQTTATKGNPFVVLCFLFPFPSVSFSHPTLYIQY